MGPSKVTLAVLLPFWPFLPVALGKGGVGGRVEVTFGFWDLVTTVLGGVRTLAGEGGESQVAGRSLGARFPEGDSSMSSSSISSSSSAEEESSSPENRESIAGGTTDLAFPRLEDRGGSSTSIVTGEAGKKGP
jgi:hypothetical protein